MTGTHHPHQPHHPHHHPHHTADPAALEDPVHHDVAAHELEVEAESDEDTDTEGDADPDTDARVDPDSHADSNPDPDADADAGPHSRGEGGTGAGEDIAPDSAWDAAPAEIGPTGDARVDAAVDRLADVRGTPTSGHVEVYEDVHRKLQDALADLDGS